MAVTCGGWRSQSVIATILAIIGIQAPLYAGAAFFLLCFWGAFPAIEFQGRHIFHFELVVLAAIAWAGTMLWRFAAASVRNRSGQPAIGRREARTRVLRAIATVGVLVAIVASTVVGARAYQIPNARAFVASYDRTPAVPVAAATVPLPNGTVRLAVDMFRQPTAREQVEEVLLRADFDFAQCGHPPKVTAVFRYAVSEPWFAAFSRETPLEDLGAPPTRVFLPTYLVVRNWIAVARFAGVEVPSTFARCVRLARMDDTSALPLLVPVTMAPDWQRKLYQRVRFGSGLGY